MVKVIERFCMVIVTAVTVGCSSTRISDSIDGVGKVSVRARTEHKYHIKKMFRKGVASVGSKMATDSLASQTEVDWLEGRAPEVFDRDGIPCSIVVETECVPDGDEGSGLAWNLLRVCTLCALPDKEVTTYVYTYRIMSDRFSHEGRFVLRRRCETWTSSIGLNVFMPFSQDENTAYCWNREGFARDGIRAELDGLALALKTMERTSLIRQTVRPVGVEIGD